MSGPDVEQDLRCPLPVGPDQIGKLLGKTLPGSTTGDDGLVELSCPNCARRARADGRPVLRVLHRFNLHGQLVESINVEHI